MDASKLQLNDLIRTVERSCRGGALERLDEAIRLSGSLERLADEVVGHLVEEARRGGASWAEVGAHLGVTRQAAQQRHVARRSLFRPRPQGKTPFDRFAPRGRQVVVHAQDEARRLAHNYVGTEHLLLGLLRERHGIAAIVVTERGLDLEGARAALVSIVGEGSEAPPGAVPFTPRAKKVLEIAVREARHLGHEQVDTEHLLLALFREREGVAAKILAEAGIEADASRARALELRSERH